MLELLIVFGLCKVIGNKVRAKGRMAIGYQFMAAGLWFGGEIAGGIVYVIVAVLVSGNIEPDLGLAAYLSCLAGAVVGVIAAFTIVHLLPPVRAYAVPATGGMGFGPEGMGPGGPGKPPVQPAGELGMPPVQANEEEPWDPRLVTCRHCGQRVLPTEMGACPKCREYI